MLIKMCALLHISGWPTDIFIFAGKKIIILLELEFILQVFNE